MENQKENKSNELLKKDVQDFIIRKDIIIKFLDNLEYSCITGKDICKEIDEFNNTFCSDEYRLLWNIFGRDERELKDMFNKAKIPEEDYKTLLDLKRKYKLAGNAILIQNLHEETGMVNRWSGFAHRAFFDHSSERLMIEFELESMNKNILYTVDDASSLYRLGSLIEYIVRDELENFIENKIPLNKDLIKEFKKELNKNQEEKEKLIGLLNKFEKMK